MEAFVGSIILFAGNFAPKGWFLCNGQLLPISQYTALFSLLGTTYGGDGRVTFGLPDLRGRAPIGTGAGGPFPEVLLGEQAGSNSVTLNITQMPIHTHTVNANKSIVGRDSLAEPTNNYLAQNKDASGNFASTPDTMMNQGMIGTAGGSQPVDIQSPYLGLNYIICNIGIYPSRP